MKFVVSILLIALLSFAIGLYLPWWSIAVVAIVVSVLIHQNPLKSFLTGFIAIFFLWGGLAWTIDVANQHILSNKIALLLPLGGSPVLLILVTALVGGLVAAFAAMTGSYFRRLL